MNYITSVTQFHSQEFIMGGAQKSMLHPYEDHDTTFGELLSLAKTFARGGTFNEKMDGCNLTWRFRDNKFYLARNYEHFRTGGQSIEDYRTYLKGHPAEDQFGRALDRLERMRNVLKATQFFDDYDDGVWVNMEVIDKKAPQMLRYDIDCFVIHSLWRFVEKPKPHTEIVKPTSMSLNRFSSILCLSGVRVLHAPTVTVPRMEFTHFYHFRNYITCLMREYDLGLENTLEDYIYESVKDILYPENISRRDTEMLAENVTGRGKHDIRKIREDYDEGTHELINKYCLSSNRLKTINRILGPIKNCWLQFGAKRLDGVVSSLITDADRSKERLDDIIEWNINVVNDNRKENPSIYNGFYEQLEKFCTMDVEPQIIEGFVFETDRYIVKLTGAFQSLNRITGTARYQFGELFEEK